jgi:hypothetical protein
MSAHDRPGYQLITSIIYLRIMPINPLITVSYHIDHQQLELDHVISADDSID